MRKKQMGFSEIIVEIVLLLWYTHCRRVPADGGTFEK